MDYKEVEKQLKRAKVISAVPKIILAVVVVGLFVLFYFINPVKASIAVGSVVGAVVVCLVSVRLFVYFSENRKRIEELERQKRKMELAEYLKNSMETGANKNM